MSVPKNKLAAITGASSGIGRYVAFELAKRGYDLIVIARRKNLLEELKKEIEAKGKSKVTVMEADLSEIAKLPDLAEHLAKHDITMFINNAGVGYLGHVLQQDPVRLANLLDVVVVALTYLTAAIGAQMAKRGGGTIVNVSSGIAYTSVRPGGAAYAAAKRYVWDFTRAVNYENEMLKNNVKLVSVQPGVIATPFSRVAQEDPSKPFADWLDKTPTDEFAKVMVERIEKGDLDFCYGALSDELKHMGETMTPAEYVPKLNSVMKRGSPDK